jgi:hypothetical protein
MNVVGKSYGHWGDILAIWYSLWPFGNSVVFWYIFHRFGIFYQQQSGSPVPMIRNSM